MSALALRLNQATQEAHRAAEGAVFVKSVMRGTVTRGDYAVFLAQLRAVYAALEASLSRHRSDVRIGPVVWPHAFRGPALEQDLAFYGLGRDAEVLPATDRYAAHLRVLADRAPHRLVAHAYTRYLGDLSGGQALKKSLQRAFGLAEDGGTRFFEFDALGDLAAAKTDFRAQLDALPLSEAEANDVVEEAIIAFRHNGSVAQAITDRAAVTAVAQPATDPCTLVA